MHENDIGSAASPAPPEIEYERITLRIPKDVHAALSKIASYESRSMNAEIVSRLRNTLSTDSIAFLPSDRAMLESLCAHLGIKTKS